MAADVRVTQDAPQSLDVLAVDRDRRRHLGRDLDFDPLPKLHRGERPPL